MTVIGIDPGKTGGIAVLGTSIRDDEKVPVIIAAYEMPCLTTKTGKERVDPDGIMRVWQNTGFFFKDLWIAFEHQQNFKGEGASSAFSTGYGFGSLKGMCVALRIFRVIEGYEIVKAVDWHREFSIKGPTGLSPYKKRKAIASQAETVVSTLFPNAPIPVGKRAGKLHSGCVDAVLIAEYYRRKLVG